MTEPPKAGAPPWVRRLADAGVSRGAWARRLLANLTGPGRARWVIAAGVTALLITGAIGVGLSRGVGEFGHGPVTSAGPGSTGPSATDPAGTVSPVPVVEGGLPVAAGAVVPVRLEIPAIGIVAKVTPVGLNEDTDEVDVPRSVDTVGWYRYGPHLGSGGGSVVIAGHVDSSTQGKGAFFRLRDLKTGAQVTVTGADRVTRTFTVVARKVYDKSSVPLEGLFARDGDLRLTLITCGGSFNAQTRSYRDNIVLTAVPA